MKHYRFKFNILKRALLLAAVVSLVVFRCSAEERLVPEQFAYVVVNCYPHDPGAFTQGLVWDEGKVYEGTGKRGWSSLRRVDLFSGDIVHKIDHQPHIFAEGVTVLKDNVYQLTWKNNVVFMYDKHDFSLKQSWKIPGEGWGLTHDDESLILSNGSSTLYFLDPKTLAKKWTVTVHDNERKISQLNELEFVNGIVYANIWHSDWIAMINPINGAVVGWIDLSGLRTYMKYNKQQNVLNGIMYDQKEDRLFVTGKYWPALFEIRLTGRVN